MNGIRFFWLLLAAIIVCLEVGCANQPMVNTKKTTGSGAAIAPMGHRRPEYAWHGRPEFKLTSHAKKGVNVKALNVLYGNFSYRFDSDIGIEAPAQTNAYDSSLSFNVVAKGYLAIDDGSNPGGFHVPYGETNETRRTFTMQWNGPSKVETVYLVANGGLTLMLAGNGKPQYVAQVRLVSTDIKWNPEPSEDGYLYGRLPLAFDYAPVLFTMDSVLRVAQVAGASQSGLTEIGEISIRVPMGQRQ